MAAAVKPAHAPVGARAGAGPPRPLPRPVAAALGALLAACWLAPQEAGAQTAVPLSGQADPGQIERRLEERARPPAGPERQPEKALPKVAPIPAGEPTGAPEALLTAVEIEGATIFDQEQLAGAYRSYLGREVTLADIGAILEAMTRTYLEAGYILSRATAPPQDLEGGVLRVRIVEGYLERVSFEGVRPGRWGLEAHAERLRAERPLTKALLERVILLIEDLPGLSVESSLRPIDDEAGLYELILSLEEEDLDGTFYLDNRGTPSVGRLEGYGSVGANAFFAMGERLQLGFFTVPNQPEELLYADLLYLQPLGADGLTGSLHLSASRVDAGDDLARFDTLSHSRGAELGLRYPVIRSRSLNLALRASFDYSNLKQEQVGFTVMDDRLRVLHFGAEGTLADSWDGVSFLGVEVSQGLDILAASRTGGAERSRFDGEAEFTKLTLEAVRQQDLPWSFGLQLSISGQTSFDPLLSSEEFALGGSRYGRAYDFSEITGEHGAVGSIELRYGQTLPLDWLPGIQFYGFFDWGAVWNDLPGGGQVRDSLSSAGGGVRFGLLGFLQTGVEVAVPLTRRVSGTGSHAPRAFFTITGTF